jgi:hypothetical protein
MPVETIVSEKLAQHILSLVTDKGMTYLDAVLYFCEQRKIEPELIAPLLGDKIKSELANDAHRLHFLKKSNELPF